MSPSPSLSLNLTSFPYFFSNFLVGQKPIEHILLEAGQKTADKIEAGTDITTIYIYIYYSTPLLVDFTT